MSAFDLLTAADDTIDDQPLLAPIVDEADLILPSTDFADLLPPAPEAPTSPNLRLREGPSHALDAFSNDALFSNDRPPPVPVSSRPLLRRDASNPPPRGPPPPTPVQAQQSAQQQQSVDRQHAAQGIPSGEDSLTMAQLRRIVVDGGLASGVVECQPYAFVYGDANCLGVEVEEWFTYVPEEKSRLERCGVSFEDVWGRWAKKVGVSRGREWVGVEDDGRRRFVREILRMAREGDLERRVKALECLVYLVLGVWHETAGLPALDGAIHYDDVGNDHERHKNGSASDDSSENSDGVADRFPKSGCQLDWIKLNTHLIFDCDGLQTVLDLFKSATDRACAPDSMRLENEHIENAEERETWCAMTLLYICLEVTRTCKDEFRQLRLRAQFLTCKPNLLTFLGNIINNLRFDDTIKIPLLKVLLLAWKAQLVMLGSTQEVDKVKNSFQEKDPARNKATKPIITASPLEYHSFRQEISSKYPAYNPPPAIFPLEPDQKSLLPPLRFNSNRPIPQSKAAEHGGSIINQPVHIATPAPSPPPSPAAGKGGKKQNYQTNQLFPFLYPPLDATSNQIGGKGTTNLQDCLVDKKWTGMDIPSSILEASELFKARVRTTRALSQLWEERSHYLKYERGWSDDKRNGDVEELQLDMEESQLDDVKNEKTQKQSDKNRIYDGSIEDRLDVVEDFYRDGLPHLQSIVVVFVRTMIANLTALITQANPPNSGSNPNFPDPNQNGQDQNENPNIGLDTSGLSLEELDAMRSQEITAKAASGLILLMLKWFKVSHVLKFEYLTQLLVDANYIPMILKLLQTQEIEKVVNINTDREIVDFFYYCRTQSRHWKDEDVEPLDIQEAPLQEESSDDDCAPPPIRRHRTEVTVSEVDTSTEQHNRPLSNLPEVDELGIPTTDLPPTPITTYSWRNFFSSINYLRILQKTCKSKAHRNLMLVTYKSAAYLKKSLRIPQRELRLYTLKLFKNQVPYCGRKWRQTNMRVITAVYLHCRPELRDDWLLSADVDADVEMSVPMEQSLRSLTHYYNLRRYAGQMGAKTNILAEQDFFLRELEKLEWSGEGFGGDGMSEEGSEAHGWDTSGFPIEHL